MLSTPKPLKPTKMLPPKVMVPVVSSISTLPVPVPVLAMLRSPAMLALAPSRMASSPEPESPTETVPVVTRSAPVPETVTMPAPLAPMPASSVVAVTVAPLVTESWPVAAAPMSNAPAIWRLEPVPVTETEEPPAVDSAAMVAVAATVRVLPSSMRRTTSWFVPTVTPPVAVRLAPAVKCHEALPPNERAAMVPVPVMTPPLVLNSTVSVPSGAAVAGLLGNVVSFQLPGLAKSVSRAPVQTSVRNGSTVPP